MATKSCEACEHPERTAIEEALIQAKPYQELKRQFKLSIGAMRRHRKGYMNGERPRAETVEEATPAVGEPAYLRFGALPEGGRSQNHADGYYEDGVSVFAARKVPGGYAVDVESEVLYADQIRLLVFNMVSPRDLYVAAGTEVGEGADGEPLLEDVALKPFPRFACIEFPHWLGNEGKRFGERWSTRRRNAGRRRSWGLEEEGAQVLVKMIRVLYDLHGDLYDDSPEELPEKALEKARRSIREWRRRWGGRGART